MQRISRILSGACALGLLSACTSGQQQIEPPFKSVDLNATTTLQFAVGTANLSNVNSITPVAGLNTVVTFRQKTNGLSATLLNTPTITGPSGFVVPTPSGSSGDFGAGNDAGTNHISGSPQVPPGVSAEPTTFGTAGGAFSYGFLPDNSTTSGGLQSNFWNLPFYTSAQLPYAGIPPAWPGTPSGVSGFAGYPPGWTDFLAPPVTGTYNLSILVPSGNTNAQTLTAAATMNSTKLLPVMPYPTITSNGAGGGTITEIVPAGITETEWFVYLAFPSGIEQVLDFVAKGSGSVTQTIPDGTTSSSGPLTYIVSIVGFDYPAFEAGPPQNVQPGPAIKGSNGQADLTTFGSCTINPSAPTACAEAGGSGGLRPHLLHHV